MKDSSGVFFFTLHSGLGIFFLFFPCFRFPFFSPVVLDGFFAVAFPVGVCSLRNI